MKKPLYRRPIIWVVIIVLFIGNIVFSINYPCSNPNVFTTISGWISGFATIILGIIALFQNEQYKLQSDLSNERIEELTVKPEVIIDHYVSFKAESSLPLLIAAPKASYADNYFFKLKTLNLPVICFTVRSISIYDSSSNIIKRYAGDGLLCNMHDITLCESYSEFYLEISIPSEYKDIDIKAEIELCYENMYFMRYTKTISFDRFGTTSSSQENLYNLLVSKAVIFKEAQPNA